MVDTVSNVNVFYQTKNNYDKNLRQGAALDVLLLLPIVSLLLGFPPNQAPASLLLLARLQAEGDARLGLNI